MEEENNLHNKICKLCINNYSYTDCFGNEKRMCVNAATLQIIKQKEEELINFLDFDITQYVETETVPEWCPRKTYALWKWTSYDELTCTSCNGTIRDEILYLISNCNNEKIKDNFLPYCPFCGKMMNGVKEQ